MLLSLDGSPAVAWLDGLAQSTQTTSDDRLPASNVVSLVLDNTAGLAPHGYSAGVAARTRHRLG